MKFSEIDAVLLQEWVAPDRIADFIAGSHNHRNRKAEFNDDIPLYAASQYRIGKLARLERYVSALDISFDLLETQRFERLAKLIHLDPMVTPNVDSAKQSDVHRHK